MQLPKKYIHLSPEKPSSDDFITSTYLKKSSQWIQPLK